LQVASVIKKYLRLLLSSFTQLCDNFTYLRTQFIACNICKFLVASMLKYKVKWIILTGDGGSQQLATKINGCCFPVTGLWINFN
jgi:hypothetical protein